MVKLIVEFGFKEIRFQPEFDDAVPALILASLAIVDHFLAQINTTEIEKEADESQDNRKYREKDLSLDHHWHN